MTWARKVRSIPNVDVEFLRSRNAKNMGSHGCVSATHPAISCTRVCNADFSKGSSGTRLHSNCIRLLATIPLPVELLDASCTWIRSSSFVSDYGQNNSPPLTSFPVQQSFFRDFLINLKLNLIIY